MTEATADMLTQWRRTSPVAVIFYAFRFLRRLGTDGLPALVPLLAWIASADGTQKTLIVSLLVLVLALAATWAVLSYLRFRFRIEADQVVVSQGVLHREQVSADFDRIQNLSVKEPFYMRPFGLAVVSIDTAGSAGKEMLLGGVKRELALALRRTALADRGAPVTEVERAGGDEGKADSSASDEEGRLLLTRDKRDIALFGLTANFMLWFAVALGLIFSAGETWEAAFESLLESLGIDELGAMLQAYSPLLLSFLVAAGIVALLALLPVLSVLGAFFRHYDFRLTLDGETYRRFGGLLSRHDESLKRHKIQAVVWKQNLVARLLHRTNIQLRVASAGVSQDQAQLAGAQRMKFVVPSLLDSERDELTAEFLPGCDGAAPEFSPIDIRRYALKALLLGWLPITALALIGPSLLLGPAVYLALPFILALGLAIVLQLGRRFGYAVHGTHAFLRSGFLGRDVNVFPLRKVQRVDLRQSPGQRRAGRAHLIVHLASHSLTMPYLPVGDAERFRDLALYHAEADRTPWY